MTSNGFIRTIVAIGLLLTIRYVASAQTVDEATPKIIVIPRVDHEPTLSEFATDPGKVGIATQLAKVERFTQLQPRDGEPCTERTEAYLGYDSRNLYVIFLAFDAADGIRGNLNRRDEAYEDGNDDQVMVRLDTFNDKRRAYYFSVNPTGVQYDALFTEGQPAPGLDKSFDTVWNSQSQRTSYGYVVRMAIPFKSLRFSRDLVQEWGILLERWIARKNEWSFWPHVSTRIEGTLNQAARLEGLESISSAGSAQAIPYTTVTRSRETDVSIGAPVRETSDRGAMDAGLDTKWVIRDRFVLDTTVNPDFSQVESDEPQVTVNERFEVLFPEKRPFFLENSNYFNTPLNLFFSRRIVDPQFGARLTGKLGGVAFGALVVDDQSPGKDRGNLDFGLGDRAWSTVMRMNWDVGRQSTLGVLLSDRQLGEGFNQVWSGDGRIKLGDHWVLTLQAVGSRTRKAQDSSQSGRAVVGIIERHGRHLNVTARYQDVAAGFVTEPGFVNRADIRWIRGYGYYDFRPEGRHLIAWAPSLAVERIEDHEGILLNESVRGQVNLLFPRQTEVGFYRSRDTEGLRPVDFPSLSVVKEFGLSTNGVMAGSKPLNSFGFRINASWGTELNFEPSAGSPPEIGDVLNADASVTLRPARSLRIESTALIRSLDSQRSRTNIFRDRIIRTKWNWQFTTALAVRLILQDSRLETNPGLTSLEDTRRRGGELLLSYQPGPGTAFYVGYSEDYQNYDIVQGTNGAEIVRTKTGLRNDSRLLFIKYSRMFQF